MPVANIIRGIRSGHWAALTSGIAMAAMGWIERNRPAAPLNGPSQWVWGTQASKARQADFRHTALGYAVHHAMSIVWGLIHNEMFPLKTADTVRQELAKAGATAVIAAFVDYKLVPRRLQPGFDRQLSSIGLVCIYAAFAFGLAASRWSGRRS
jgi:hypothetical protein